MLQVNSLSLEKLPSNTSLDRSVRRLLTRSCLSVSTMGTLFSDKILTPPPDPAPEPAPLQLNLQRTASIQNLPNRNNELTEHSQNQPEPNDHTFYTHGEPSVPPSKRRGNPRLLFMGMRRFVASAKPLFWKLMSELPDVASRPFRRSCSKSCHRRTHCISSLLTT